MIKALGRTGAGVPLLVLGLSAENVRRLLADEPITFNLSELGLPPAQVIIVGGPTEDAIMGLLAGRGLLTRELTMTVVQAWIIVVLVGVIALCQVVDLLRR